MAKNYQIDIGNKKFKSKKEALLYYKHILTSYKKKEFLNNEDFKNLSELFLYSNKFIILSLKAIMVDMHIKYKSTKCFYIIFSDNSKKVFSYILAINGSLSREQLFNRACREAISNRLRKLKKNIFKNLPVKCAITNKILEWKNCHIDHKSPLTFSVIIKAFIFSNNIDLDKVEYIENEGLINFKDINLLKSFDSFHKKMAVLRPLSKEENLKRSGNSRVKPTSKDLLL